MNPSIKKVLGIALIMIGFIAIVALAFPTLSDPQHAGRSEKRLLVDFPFLKNETSKVVLVYFGYVGCTDVCTPALQDLAQVHQLSKKYGFVQEPSIWFINMTPQMDTLSVQSWAEHFDPEFKSYAPNQVELVKMAQTLNMIYTQLGTKAEHRPYAYLLQKTLTGYQLRYIYTSSPYNRALILQDIGVLQ